MCFSNLALNNFIDVAFNVRHFFVVYSTNILILHDNLSMPQIGRLKGFQVLCSYNDYMTVSVSCAKIPSLGNIKGIRPWNSCQGRNSYQPNREIYYHFCLSQKLQGLCPVLGF